MSSSLLPLLKTRKWKNETRIDDITEKTSQQEEATQRSNIVGESNEIKEMMQ